MSPLRSDDDYPEGVAPTEPHPQSERELACAARTVTLTFPKEPGRKPITRPWGHQPVATAKNANCRAEFHCRDCGACLP